MSRVGEILLIRRFNRTPTVVGLAFALHAGAGIAAPPESPEVGVADLVVSQVRGVLGDITRELAVRDDVYSEEVIETESDAATRIVFLDGTELAMGPSSRMVLDRYIYDPNTGAGEMVMEVVSGVFEFASGDIEPEGYDIQTPFGNLAVRGTRCAFAIEPGEQLVITCSELESVSIGGQTLDSTDDCLVLSRVDGPAFLDVDDCFNQLQSAITMATLLGIPTPFDIAPGAGPVTPTTEEFGGPGDNDNGDLGISPPGVSPQ